MLLIHALTCWEHASYDDSDVRPVPLGAADTNVATPVISDDLALAEATSVAEAFFWCWF